MDDHGLLFNALIYLFAAILFVPLAQYLGLGAVLGYLLAGVVIGPWGLGIITDVQDIIHFAEFGVVLLLFLIGLELNPKRLWEMRKPILGMGSFQVFITGILIFAIALLFNLSWQVALIAAMGLSLSSTAIALQTLKEQNLLDTPAGNKGFSILLFQDIAVIPMITLVPLLGVAQASSNDESGWLVALKVLGVIFALVLFGRYLTRPIFRIIAKAKTKEIFTAFSLALVIGIALLMQSVGMSMALGAFLAGVLLAESEYRHQLESDIEPFKGLLLGLFFIAVGMAIDFGLLLEDPVLILSLVALLVVIKFLVLFSMTWLFKVPTRQRYLFSFVLSQGGEFAFVLLTFATSVSALPVEIAAILTVVVALSMLTTPLLMIINAKFIEPRFSAVSSVPMDKVEPEDNQVVIAGFGRFGQIVARLLHANKIGTTIIDHNPDHIERVRKFGFKVFYGDITRLDLLHSAGLDKAKLFVLAVDDRQKGIQAVEMIREHYPHVKIIARAWDMIHAYDLLDHDVEIFERETFDSALRLGSKALNILGMPAHKAHIASQQFREHDLQLLLRMYAVHQDQSEIINLAQQARIDLEKLFEADQDVLDHDVEKEWN